MRQQASQKKRRFVGWLLFLVVTVVAGGCGRGAKVMGKVTYQGRPVVYGSVVILGADNKAHSGVIGPEGSYTVEGVAPGLAKITVLSHDPTKGRSAAHGPKPAQPGQKPAADPEIVKGWFPLPRKYEDPETSGLDRTIDSGSVMHDLELQ